MNAPDLKTELAALHEASFGWALGRCGWDREEAADVLQESYLKVIDGRARYGGRSSLKTWFFGVIRHTASERRRRRIFRALGLSRFEQHSRTLPVASESDCAEESESSGTLKAALTGLARRQQESLELVFYHGLTIEEAAAVMEISVGTARVHYERGKKRLREILSQEGVQHE